MQGQGEEVELRYTMLQFRPLHPQVGAEATRPNVVNWYLIAEVSTCNNLVTSLNISVVTAKHLAGSL